MNNHKKIIVFGTLIAMFLCFMTGCREKSSNSQVISAAELKNIMSNGEITMAAGSACKFLVAPKNQKTALSKVVTWLKQAEPYKGEIPKSEEFLIISNAYSGPTGLSICNSDNHIYIEPAYYMVKVKGFYSPRFVKNVVRLNNDEKYSYIKSRQLYNYIKNDKWKKDFKTK